MARTTRRRSGRAARRLGLTLAALGLALVPVLRTWGRQWGATEAEVDARLPGDDLLPAVSLDATRAIGVRARREDVWPWLVQLGQDRGGFYSYTSVENLLGLHVRNASRVEERWQHLAVGDEVRLGPRATLRVVTLDPARALVLAAPDDAFTWAFVLRDDRDGGTRLVVRERYAARDEPSAGLRLATEAVALVSTVMSRAMLRGVRARAEARVARREAETDS